MAYINDKQILKAIVHIDRYEDGQKAKYDEFWNSFQNSGSRTDYVYAFAGVGWMSNPLFPPKYHINSPSRCFGMFAYFNFNTDKTQYDMTEICKYVDFSGTNYCAQLFRNAMAKNITLNLSNCTNATEMFQCHSGGSVDNITLKITEKLSNTTNMFQACSDLKELRFTNDSVLATSLGLGDCKNLSKESIISVMSSLSHEVTGKKLVLSLTAVNNAFKDNNNDYINLVVQKSNWTIALA